MCASVFHVKVKIVFTLNTKSKWKWKHGQLSLILMFLMVILVLFFPSINRKENMFSHVLSVQARIWKHDKSELLSCWILNIEHLRKCVNMSTPAFSKWNKVIDFDLPTWKSFAIYAPDNILDGEHVLDDILWNYFALQIKCVDQNLIWNLNTFTYSSFACLGVYGLHIMC